MNRVDFSLHAVVCLLAVVFLVVIWFAIIVGMGHDDEPLPFARRTFDSIFNAMVAVVDGPVVWFRETVVEPNRKQYNWYHKVYKRVATIDQCIENDRICRFEAEEQFKRDKKVESAILNVLNTRVEECIHHHYPDGKEICKPLHDTYSEAVDNWFIKYGDLGATGGAKDALMKQKHRMVWERRHGPVGTGMKNSKE